MRLSLPWTISRRAPGLHFRRQEASRALPAALAVGRPPGRPISVMTKEVAPRGVADLYEFLTIGGYN
jgi:hypothetical protein